MYSEERMQEFADYSSAQEEAAATEEWEEAQEREAEREAEREWKAQCEEEDRLNALEE